MHGFGFHPDIASIVCSINSRIVIRQRAVPSRIARWIRHGSFRFRQNELEAISTPPQSKCAVGVLGQLSSDPPVNLWSGTVLSRTTHDSTSRDLPHEQHPCIGQSPPCGAPGDLPKDRLAWGVDGDDDFFFGGFFPAAIQAEMQGFSR